MVSKEDARGERAIAASRAAGWWRGRQGRLRGQERGFPSRNLQIAFLRRRFAPVPADHQVEQIPSSVVLLGNLQNLVVRIRARAIQAVSVLRIGLLYFFAISSAVR